MSWLDVGSILIGRSGADHVSLSVTGRRPEGWLIATLEISASPWAGRCGVWLLHGQPRQFAQDIDRLYRDLVGVARLGAHAPDLKVELGGNGRGQVRLTGEVRHPDGNALTFGFELDQTELPAISSALREA